MMKTYKNLYTKLCSIKNLNLAFKKAREDKTSLPYVVKFEENLEEELKELNKELFLLSYQPLFLKRFIIRDPKTRIIHASAFRDRVVYHAICNILEPIFDKIFIHDSYASRKNKGTHKAVERFGKFKRKVSNNGKLVKNHYDKNNITGYALKADIKHYFENVDHEILLNIIKSKIKDEKVILLIKKILDNFDTKIKNKGMPLGNLTSQFFANIYLNELDYFVKHKLKAKYYIRYVDDFVLLHSSKSQLQKWKYEIENFLKKELELELHKEKSRIISLSKGVDFVGFRNFYHFKLLRKRNIKNMKRKIKLFNQGQIPYETFFDIFQGWYAYANWADTYNLVSNLTFLVQTRKSRT